MEQIPENVDEILNDPEYWTEAFLLTFLEEWKHTAASNPQKAAQAAEVGVKLAKIIGDRLLARALFVQGSAFRLVSDTGSSDDTFSQALRLVDNDDFELRADAARRMAYSRSFQFRFDEAEKLADEAIDLCSRGSDSHSLGAAILCKGIIKIDRGLPAEAVPLIKSAVEKLRPERCPLTYYAAIHNLAEAVIHVGDLKTIRDVLAIAKGARKYLRKSESIPRQKLRWIVASASMRLGALPYAERVLKKVLEAFVAQNLLVEVVMVSLDLALVYYFQADAQKMLKTLKEAHDVARQSLPGVVASKIEACIKEVTSIQDEQILAARLSIRNHRLLQHKSKTAPDSQE